MWESYDGACVDVYIELHEIFEENPAKKNKTASIENQNILSSKK